MATQLDRLTVQQYLNLIVEGVIPQEPGIELLNGRLVEQMTKYPPHNYTGRQLGLVLKALIPLPYLISEEKSLNLGRYWRPEPDLAIVRGPNTRYRRSDPTSADVGLLIEVADSSYATDRGEKWRAYAAARIPIYWIVNINQSQVEVYREPIGRGAKSSYRVGEIYEANAEVPVVIDGQEVGRIVVSEILP